MNKLVLSGILALIVAVAAALLPTLPAAAQDGCTLSPNYYYSSTALGDDDNNDGLSTDAPFYSLERAEEAAGEGGGCIYSWDGTTAVFEKQVDVTTAGTGIPVAPPVLYGILFALAAVLTIAGLWVRRQSLQLQTNSEA